MIDLKTPDSIQQHSQKYQADAWKQYTPEELGNWVHLFIKRSAHRTDEDKKTSDLDNAQCYLDMLQAHLNARRS